MAEHLHSSFSTKALTLDRWLCLKSILLKKRWSTKGWFWYFQKSILNFFRNFANKLYPSEFNSINPGKYSPGFQVLSVFGKNRLTLFSWNIYLKEKVFWFYYISVLSIWNSDLFVNIKFRYFDNCIFSNRSDTSHPDSHYHWKNNIVCSIQERSKWAFLSIKKHIRENFSD